MTEASADRTIQSAIERGHAERARVFRQIFSAFRPRLAARTR